MKHIEYTKFCRINLLILLALFSFSVSEMELTKWRGKARSMSYKSFENLSFHLNTDYISEIIIRVKCLQISISQSISFFTFEMGIKGTFPVWFLGSWCLCGHGCDRRWEPPLLQLSGEVFTQATTSLCSLHKEQCPGGVYSTRNKGCFPLVRWGLWSPLQGIFCPLLLSWKNLCRRNFRTTGGKGFAFKRKILPWFSVQPLVC